MEDPKHRKAQGTLALLQQLVRDEGFPTLYRGLVPVLQSLWISNFVYFYSFHTLKAIASPPGSASVLRDLGLATVAGIINVLATTPFWVVNTRLKMKGLEEQQQSPKAATTTLGYANLIEGLRYIWRTEGMAGLWAGTMPSLMLVSNPALQFMMYESLKRQLSAVSAQPPGVAFFVIGAMAKAFATVVTYPLQLVQTKLRHGSGQETGVGPNAGVLEMCVYILKTYGAAGLFRGLEAKLLQTVLTAALMFAAYEKIAAVVMSLLLRSKKGGKVM